MRASETPAVSAAKHPPTSAATSSTTTAPASSTTRRRGASATDAPDSPATPAHQRRSDLASAGAASPTARVPAAGPFAMTAPTVSASARSCPPPRSVTTWTTTAMASPTKDSATRAVNVDPRPSKSVMASTTTATVRSTKACGCCAACAPATCCPLKSAVTASTTTATPPSTRPASAKGIRTPATLATHPRSAWVPVWQATATATPVMPSTDVARAT